MPPRRSQRVRCPIHNLIEFAGDELGDTLWNLVQTKAFQRLRRIKQLGFSEFVYPGATHSRFSHSLGVYHLAHRLFSHLAGRFPHNNNNSQRDMALLAALLHDIGHGPFSHAFENAMKDVKLNNNNIMRDNSHEAMSEKIITDPECEISPILDRFSSGYSSQVARMLRSSPTSRYAAIVSSQFDADRLDYMQRDRIMTGTQVGSIDLTWLIDNIELGRVQDGSDEESSEEVMTLVLNPKALHAAEAYILNLFHLYPTVYFHKSTRCLEVMFSSLFRRVAELICSGDVEKTNLPSSHSLVRLIQDFTPVNYLDVDDAVVMGALPMLSQSPDRLISDFSHRILHRKLYKCIELFSGSVESKEKKAVKTADKALRWSDLNSHDGIPRILYDTAKRDPYQRSQGKGPLTPIYVKTGNNETDLMDLKELSQVANGVKTFRFHRLYCRKDDNKAIEKIDDIKRSNRL